MLSTMQPKLAVLYPVQVALAFKTCIAVSVLVAAVFLSLQFPAEWSVVKFTDIFCHVPLIIWSILPNEIVVAVLFHSPTPWSVDRLTDMFCVSDWIPELFNATLIKLVNVLVADAHTSAAE